MPTPTVPWRKAAAPVAIAVSGLATAVLSGLALVPRVRLVEVIIVIAGAIGAGAAFVWTIVEIKAARAADRYRNAPPLEQNRGR